MNEKMIKKVDLNTRMGGKKQKKKMGEMGDPRKNKNERLHRI